MRINVHAGHNPANMIGCGACGLLNESTEDRRIKNIVIKLLEEQGHTVYDCTCDNGTSQGDVLNKIVAKCNAHTVDLDVSIHLNAGGGHGTEVLVYDLSKNSPVTTAENIASAISNLGFTNRGIKTRPELTVLCKTKAPALLIECCFVDSQIDYNIYNAESMAKAIVFGITGSVPKGESKSDTLYRVQVGAFHNKEYAEAYKDKLEEDGYNGFVTEGK